MGEFFLWQALVKEELNGEGVELDLISAMKELAIQDSEIKEEATTDVSGTVFSDSSKVRKRKFIVIVLFLAILGLNSKLLMFILVDFCPTREYQDRKGGCRY